MAVNCSRAGQEGDLTYCTFISSTLKKVTWIYFSLDLEQVKKLWGGILLVAGV